MDCFLAEQSMKLPFIDQKKEGRTSLLFTRR